LKKAARRYLGSNTHWHTLCAKLDAQGWKCAYTGETLVLGLNDSVDHVYPVSTHPEMASDPDNIEWTTREVNVMERDRTPEQFMALVRAIFACREAGLRAPSEPVAA